MSREREMRVGEKHCRRCGVSIGAMLNNGVFYCHFCKEMREPIGKGKQDE